MPKQYVVFSGSCARMSTKHKIIEWQDLTLKKCAVALLFKKKKKGGWHYIESKKVTVFWQRLKETQENQVLMAAVVAN